MDTFVSIHQDLKGDALTNRKPMQLSQVWSGVVFLKRTIDMLCRPVLDTLESL